jgi:ribosome-binding factor A
MSRRRQERVTELIQQEISKRIPFLKDPGLGFITVLAVRLTPDFNQAKVYYSVLGSAEERERTHAALDRARGYFRAQLRSLENLKFPPEIIFVQDNSAEEAQRVLDTLSQLAHEREAGSPDPSHPS